MFFHYLVIAELSHDLIEGSGSAGLEISNAFFHRFDLFRCQWFVIIGGFSQTADYIIVCLTRIQFQIIEQRLGIGSHPHRGNPGHILMYMCVYGDKIVVRSRCAMIAWYYQFLNGKQIILCCMPVVSLFFFFLENTAGSPSFFIRVTPFPALILINSMKEIILFLPDPAPDVHRNVIAWV